MSFAANTRIETRVLIMSVVDLSSAPPAPVSAAPPSTFRIVLLLLLASVGLCALAYLAITVQGAWFGGAPTLHWTPREFTVARGSGQLRPDGLALTATDPTNAVLVSLNTSLRSADYPVIAWTTIGVADAAEVGLLWRNDYEPGRVFNRRLEVDAGHVQPLSLLHDPNWVGRISGLALAIKAKAREPSVIQGATAKTMSPRELLVDRVSEWFTFEPWNGASINTLIGGADTQDLPMVFAFALIVSLAVALYAALAKWRPGWLGTSRAAVVGGIFIAAWIALDVRWEWNLARQVAITAKIYAGKSWRERHLSDNDGAVFQFIEKVRAKLPPPPARIFLVADEHYYRDRGAYHLYPYNVYCNPWENSIPPPSAVHRGDYFVVYQQRGVEYDAANRRLRWYGNEPVSAELLMTEAGSALFRIL